MLTTVPETATRRRPATLRVVVVLAAVTMVATVAACGSEAPETSEPASDPGPTAPGTVAPTDDAAGSGAPPPATPTSLDAPASTTEVPPLPAQPAPSPSPQPAASAADPPRPQGDASGVREFPSNAVWEALRQCQSQGDYTYVHPSGQYFGAYQFTVATWDRLANQRYTELLGVLPSEAAPADQDRMAYYLWIESGHARWPACSHVFTGDPPPGGTAGDGVSPPPAGDPDGTAGGTAGSGDDGSAAPPPQGDAEPAGPTTTSPGDLPQLEIDPSIQPAVPPDVPGFPTEEQWEALRFCEASGNYRAVSRNGRFFGAYQFWPDTWDFVASRNYPRLVGILPSDATPEDQTRMAYRLWEERGDQPWPVCGRHLRSGTGGSGG